MANQLSTRDSTPRAVTRKPIVLQPEREPEPDREPGRMSTGVPGLDEILDGGLIPGRTYLVRGDPGSGKTTLGMHFLTCGASQGEKVLCITLAETEAQLRKDAGALGFNLEGVVFLDLSPTSEYFAQVQSYDIFTPAEVEREPTTQRIMETVRTLRPRRVFLDTMTQLRYLSQDAFQFRREALSFLRFLVENGATVLFTSEVSEAAPDDDLQFMADGIITQHTSPTGRQLVVQKFRGSGYAGERHSYRLGPHGMEVFPRLLPETEHPVTDFAEMGSGIPQMDEMLHGGLERGTITIISGPSGVGKTTLGLQFIKEAAGRGEPSIVYLFEESADILIQQCEQVSIPARAMIDSGMLSLVPVEPLQFTPDEFASRVRRDVQQLGCRIVMIDSVDGYRLSLHGEDLVIRLHELGKYLNRRGVSLMVINEVEAITGEFRATETGISYLADNIIFLRYIEVNGELRRAIGVLKKRLGEFEKSLRELQINRYGLQIGNPLVGLRGILRGTPEWSETKQVLR